MANTKTHLSWRLLSGAASKILPGGFSKGCPRHPGVLQILFFGIFNSACSLLFPGRKFFEYFSVLAHKFLHVLEPSS
jgi:hypothetical protein